MQCESFKQCQPLKVGVDGVVPLILIAKDSGLTIYEFYSYLCFGLEFGDDKRNISPPLPHEMKAKKAHFGPCTKNWNCSN